MLTWLTRRAERKANAHKIYGSIVALSRSPAIYDTLKVPDTIEGRFEIMLLHMFATLERLNGEEAQLAQDIVNKFFADMDTTSRELGVGDMVVPKKMRGLATIFETRMKAYEDVVADSNKNTLYEQLHDTIFHGEEGHSDSALGLGDYMMQLRQSLAKIPLVELVSGQIAVPVMVGNEMNVTSDGLVEDVLCSRIFKTDEISAKGISECMEVSADDRAAIAKALDLLNLDSMRMDFRLFRSGRGRFKLKGQLSAEAKQSCVVTLEPVECKVDEQIAVEFWPPKEVERLEIEAEKEGMEVPLDGPEPIMEGCIDVGHLAYVLL